LKHAASRFTWHVVIFFMHCIGFYFYVIAGVHGQARAPEPSASERAGPPWGPAPGVAWVHPGDAVLATVPSHARLADSLTPPSPPASHPRPPPPPLPRNPPAPWGKRHATPAPSSIVAKDKIAILPPSGPIPHLNGIWMGGRWAIPAHRKFHPRHQRMGKKHKGGWGRDRFSSFPVHVGRAR